MTNKLALWLGALILAALILDQTLNDGIGFLFLARKLIELIEWVAFWR